MATNMVSSNSSSVKCADEILVESPKSPKNNESEARLGNGCQEDNYYDSECWEDTKNLLESKTDTNAEEPCEMSCQRGPSTKTYNVNGSDCFTDSTKEPSSNRSISKHQRGTKAASNFDEDDELILHKAIFNNDTTRIIEILKDEEFVKRKNLLNIRDKHGNSALHLACMLGRSSEVIRAILDCHAECVLHLKNLNRWTPFHEACSYGDREIITLLTKQLEDEVEDALSGSKLAKFLERTKNYRLVLKWEFQSWVPFVSRVLPSDVCVITKQGKFIRIETRLLDVDSLFKKKCDSCLIYSNKKWIVVNHKTKKYQYFESPNVYKSIDDRVDEFMSNDIMDLELKSSELQFTRSTSGWIWKENKVIKVGRFNAALYDFTNVFLVTRKRREHLSEEDLKRNKTAYKNAVYLFKFGERANTEAENFIEEEGESVDDTSQGSDDQEDTVIRRKSLPPPEPRNVSWSQYIDSEPGKYPTLGREQKCKTIETAVKASVAMSEEFPLTKKEFLELLSVVPLKMFKKLEEFVDMKLPEGFPVRLDIPIYPFLTARISFEDFSFLEGPIDESLYSVPSDFEKATNLLPSRFTGPNI